MKHYQFHLIAFFTVIITLTSFSVNAAAPDIYLVYAGSDKSLAKSIKKSLSSKGKIKLYNASILLMADYSGKQKAVARLSKAKLVVFVSGAAKPTDLIDEGAIPGAVSVIGEGEENISKILSSL
ncbi:MAG: hypothetical protein COA99_01690 [Moraxellaceae bacterium]|nr:MAG: hypothetical protein COA99_01690 [Moraxellaceae bacterium]